MDGSVKVTGLREMNSALKKLDAKVANKISRAGIAEAAKVMRKEMRERAPRDSGNLRKNIKYKLRRFQRRGFTGTVGVTRKAFYAGFIEYGSSPHRLPAEKIGRGRGKRKNNAKISFDGGVFSGANHPGISPKPFLRPAFEAKKEAAIKSIGVKIWALIKKEASKTK